MSDQSNRIVIVGGGAYHGLQRQYQLMLLGPLRGSLDVLSDVLGRTAGPRMKVYSL